MQATQNGKARQAWTMLGLVSAAWIGSLVSAPRVAEDLPPHMGAGVSIYGIELCRPIEEILPGVGPSTPVKVLGNEGRWYLLQTPNQPRGPQWVNFDQVLSYRTQQ